MNPSRSIPFAALLLAMGACMPVAGPGTPPPPPSYTALPDTLVCVVDRAAGTGLRPLPAKKGAGGEVLLHSAGQVRDLEEVHPVALLAGYAGNEPWLQRGDAITLGSERYQPYQGQRRVPIEQLERAGEHQAIPLYAARGERPPHPTLYVPVRPGCVFQPYVRADLLRR